MIVVLPEQLDIFCLEETVWLAEAKINVPAYDFRFDSFFACRRPLYRPEMIKAVGRFGVANNYSELFEKLKSEGVELVHTPEQYLLASELTNWYIALEDLTPRSIWFDAPPTANEIEKQFDYPIFVKGSRQTSRHRAEFSIVRSRQDYERVIANFQQDSILHWQNFVVREFVELRPVAGKSGDKIPPSFEFRTFWWYGELVGAGAYWKDFAEYSWNESEKFSALQVAQKAVERLNLPFIVIDLAQTKTGDWIVIECNDGQESGYAAVSPIALWQNIIEIEK